MKHLDRTTFLNFYKSKYTCLLIALVLLIILSPRFHETVLGQALLCLATTLVFITAIIILRASRKQLIFFIALTIINVILEFLNIFTENHLILIIAKLFFVIYCFSITVIFATRIVSTKVVHRDTIYGAICVYLLIGVSYGVLYSIIELFAPGSFQYIRGSSQTLTDFDFFYFSFITLTTVGFGDITALSHTARSLVMLESVTGIFYLATLVSRLVSHSED